MSNEWRELKTLQDVAAAQAAGDEVEYLMGNSWQLWGGSFWSSLGAFRARPRQPKMKKVKLLCWLNPDTGILFWRKENHATMADSHWLRVPSEDKEIEVPE